MKKIIAGLFFMCIALFAIAQKEIVHDANAELRIITENFTGIKVSSGISLYLSQGDDEVIAVSAAENKYKEGIKTLVEGGVLKIYYFGSKGWNSDKKNMRVYVSFKNLEKIDASGASDIQIAGSITVPSLNISLSGASDFKGAVAVTNLKLDLSGASDVTIKGTATTVHIETSGASDVKGYDLKTDFCNANASGASDINITVNKELNAGASGASSISYKGDGVIKAIHAGGASSVSKKG